MTWGGTASAAAPGDGPAATPDGIRLAEIFERPPAAYTPVPIWWWSGGRLSADRLRWQLERLVEGGIRNVMVLNLAPAGPLYGSDPDDPPLFSDAWWELFLGVCRDARELGVRIWFYDQIGFSGANFQGRLVRSRPALAGRWLGRTVVEGEGPLEARCPAGAEPLMAVSTIIAEDPAVRGERVQLRVEDGVARDHGPGRRRLVMVHASARDFDYLGEEACAALLDTVHGTLERRAGALIGEVIVGSFQDELGELPTWSAGFASAFRAAAGYDVVPSLDLLWDGDDPRAARLRVDYQRVRGELAERAFFRPLFEWHQSRGLVCGFDNLARFGDPRSGVALYADYQRTHRWFAAPGSDHAGEAKLNSSLAHLYGRPRVWIEAFHSSGWGGTLEETVDWLIPWLRAGATLYNPHAVYYSTHGGWWEWAAPSTCWRQPYWRHYGVFAEAVTRLCAVLSQGVHVCDVGVLHPSVTVQANLTLDGRLLAAGAAAQDAYMALVGRLFWHQPAAGVLDRDGRDFDVLDESSLQAAEIAGGALAIGGERYRALVLPGCALVEEATARVVSDFARSGGRVIAVGCLPDGLPADGVTVVAGVDDVPAALVGVPRTVTAPVPTLRRRTADAEVVLVPAAYPRATEGGFGSWEEDGWTVDYAFQPNRRATSVTLHVEGVAGDPELWDPFTGARRSLAARAVEGGCQVEVPFDSAPLALLVWAKTGVAPPPAASEQEAEAVAALDGVWTAALEPTLDNRFGDLDWPAFTGSPPVQTWTLVHRVEGPAEDGMEAGWHRGGTDGEAWAPAHATYGQFGWRAGPLPAARLPEPQAAPGPEPQAAPEPEPPPGAPGWQPVVYSLSRGILHDPAARYSLGPKGHVPEEFIDFGLVEPGHSVQFRTSVWCEESTPCHLALGAPARKRAWVNGEEVSGGSEGYLWTEAVELRAGVNTIEWRLEPEEGPTLRALNPGRWQRTLRAHWSLLRSSAEFARPEWLTTHRAAGPGDLVRFRASMDLGFAPRSGTLQLGTTGSARLSVNGAEVGRQEANYGGWIQPYAVDLRRGRNEVEVEVLADGQRVGVLVDALAVGESGDQATLISDRRWTVEEQGGAPQPAPLRPDQWMDPAWAHLHRRPHPLPRAAWLEDAVADSDVVLDMVPSALPPDERVEWLAWRLPPGVTEVRIPVDQPLRLWVGGEEVAVTGGTARVARSPEAGTVAVARVAARDGRTGGALLSGPIAYHTSSGPMRLGSWRGLGLASWSGGVRYRARFSLGAAGSAGGLHLDLGRVRGTAEAWLNGRPLGVRILAPYRFDIDGAAVEGDNHLEVLVLNTLAPYLASVSPTRYLSEGQLESGLMGPVQVLRTGVGQSGI